MRVLTICLLIIVLFYSNNVFANDIISKIEGYINSNNFEMAMKVVDELPDNKEKRDLKFRVKCISDFYSKQQEFINIPDNDYEQVYRYYQKTLKSSWQILPKKLPFSHDLVLDLNSKNKAAVDKFNTAVGNRNRIAREKEATERAHYEAEQVKKEEQQKKEASEWQAMRERQRHESEKRQELHAAREIIENSSDYKKAELGCRICSTVDDNNRIKREMAEDARYSQKYGVVNYGRRDRYVQAIKMNDRSLAEGKVEYKELTGKNFNMGACRKVDSLTCVDDLDALSIKLAERYLPK